jgi:hypothetical protein
VYQLRYQPFGCRPPSTPSRYAIFPANCVWSQATRPVQGENAASGDRRRRLRMAVASWFPAYCSFLLHLLQLTVIAVGRALPVPKTGGPRRDHSPVQHDVLNGPATARGRVGFPARARATISALRDRGWRLSHSNCSSEHRMDLPAEARATLAGDSRRRLLHKPRLPDSYEARASAPRCSYGSMLATDCTTGATIC